MSRDAFTRLLVRAWLATAVVDGLFACALSVFAYHSTVGRLWRGVASTVLGPEAMDRGASIAWVGVAMHVGVALFWTSVFLSLAVTWPALRRVLATPRGIFAAATVYGPCVWIVMSLVVIPLLTGRPPRITGRWWIQAGGHVMFVALPMVTVIARGLTRIRIDSSEPARAVVV